MQRKILSNPYLIIPILIFGFALRAFDLEADIPYFVDYAYMTDEGGWAHNARHKYIHGAWITGTHDAPFFTAPGYSYIIYGVFNVFGMSLCSGRLISVFAGSMTLFIIWMFMRARGNVTIANTAALILAFTGIHILYSRLLMAEVLLTFMLALSIYFWSIKNKPICAVMAGISISVTMILKLSATFFLPVFGILLVAELIRKEITIKTLALIITAFILSMTIFAILIYLPFLREYSEWINSNLKHLNKEAEISLKYIPEIFLFNRVSNELGYGKMYNKLFLLMPIISMAVIIYLSRFLTNIKSSVKKTITDMTYIELVGLSIIMGNMLLISVNSLKTERRYVPIIIGMVMLAAHMWQKNDYHTEAYRSQQARNILKETACNFAKASPLIIFISYTLFEIFGTWNFIDIGNQRGLSFYGQTIMVSPIYIAIVYYISRKSEEWSNVVAISSGTLVVAHIVAGLSYYMMLYLGREQTSSNILVVTWVIWPIIYVIWNMAKQINKERLRCYSLYCFIVMQTIVIGFIFFKTTYTFNDLCKTIQSDINTYPIMTDISAPLLKDEGRLIYYGFPTEQKELDKNSTYYVLNAFKKAEYTFDIYLTGNYYRVERIPDNAKLLNTYKILPYGQPKQYGLIVGLWEIKKDI